jgi:Cu(I)/Ag(I) efflux system membrane fusion protein
MDPQVKENKPGKCPICGMQLIPVHRSSHLNTGEIALSDQQIQLGNIQADTIRNGAVDGQTGLNATLGFDQSKTSSVSARAAGRIEKLYFKTIGDYVARGDRLYDVYSEALNNAKQEYLLALEKQKTLDHSIIDFTQLVQAAKNKLLLWGMTEAQVAALARNKNAGTVTPFYSTASGFITSLDIREGDYVAEGGAVVQLADLSTLWAEAQVYSSQLAGIDMNGQAVVQFPGMPGREAKGRIAFVNPEINADTRLNLIRVTIPNPGYQLKPGMLAYVVIKNQQHRSLSLAADAVLRDARGTSVWLQTGKKTFKYRMVQTGTEGNDRIEITSGLRVGDVVVVSGAYLLNSEYIFKQGALY